MISPHMVEAASGALMVEDGTCRAIMCGTERAKPTAAEPSTSRVHDNISTSNSRKAIESEAHLLSAPLIRFASC